MLIIYQGRLAHRAAFFYSPNMKYLILLVLLLFIGCGTTDSTLQSQGRSPGYIQGFHDGRHSGMSEQGNAWEHYIRDEARFKTDTDYKSGWLAGESEGQRLQAQATNIGNAASGAYSYESIHKEVEQQRDFDQIAKDAVKGTDTSSLNNLE